MQVNGVGADHNSNNHNVTSCLHEHSVGKKDGSGMRSVSLDTVTLSNQSQVPQQEGQLTLSAWLDKTLNSGKNLLQRIWGSDQSAVTNGTMGQSMEEQVLTAFSDNGAAVGVGVDAGRQSNYEAYNAQPQKTLHTSQIAVAATAVQADAERRIQQNPYFSAVDAERTTEGLWQKLKVKLKETAGRLTGRFPGKFAGAWAKGAFQTKQEQPKEDLRKRSKYRQDELEIDCVLTDDSYLQDSYNKKGEYSKLAGDMRGNMSKRQ